MKYFRATITYMLDQQCTHSVIRSCEDANEADEKVAANLYLKMQAMKENGITPLVDPVYESLTLTQWNKLTIVAGNPAVDIGFEEDFSVSEPNFGEE